MMKKITLLLALLMISFGYSQDLPLDFSTADQLGSVGDGATSSIVKDGENDVLQLVGANHAWDHAKFTFTKNVDLSDDANNTITFKIKPVNGTGGGNHLLKFEGGTGGPEVAELQYTTSGTDWQTITLDFPAGLGNYSALVFFVDSGDAGAGFADTYLVDDIAGGTLVTEVVEKPNLPLDFSTANHLGTVGDGATSSIVKDGENDVLQLVGANQAWDHAKFEFKNNVDLSDDANNTISFKIKPVNGTGGGNHLLKFEGGSGGPAIAELPYTTTGTDWQTITLDFPAGLGNYSALVFFVDSGDAGAGFADTYLVDDIAGGTLVTEVVEKPNLPLDFSTANHLGTVGDGATSSIVKDGENDVLQLVGANHAWDHAKFEFKDNVDLSDDANNSISFKIKPVNGTGGGNHLFKFEGGTGGPAIAELPYTTTGTDWQTITLDFPAGLGNYSTLVFFVDSGDAGAAFADTYLIDDISIAEGSGPVDDPEPTDAPATPPTYDANNVMSIYGEAHTASVAIANVSWDDSAFEEITIAGNKVLKITGANFLGIDFDKHIDATSMTHLHMDYWIGSDWTEGQVMNPKLSNHAAQVGETSAIDISNPISSEAEVKNWQSKDFPLSGDRESIKQLLITQSGKSPLFYLDNVYLYIDGTASLDNNELLNIRLYPNPTSSRLNLSAPNTIQNAAIYNLLGKEVMSVEINKNSESIDVSNLASGMYLIKYSIDNAVGTAKFIKQ